MFLDSRLLWMTMTTVVMNNAIASSPPATIHVTFKPGTVVLLGPLTLESHDHTLAYDNSSVNIACKLMIVYSQQIWQI